MRTKEEFEMLKSLMQLIEKSFNTVDYYNGSECNRVIDNSGPITILRTIPDKHGYRMLMSNGYHIFYELDDQEVKMFAPIESVRFAQSTDDSYVSRYMRGRHIGSFCVADPNIGKIKVLINSYLLGLDINS